MTSENNLNTDSNITNVSNEPEDQSKTKRLARAVTRRNFLKVASAAGVSVGLAGCSSKATDVPVTSTSTVAAATTAPTKAATTVAAVATAAAPATTVATVAQATATPATTATGSGYPRLSIAKVSALKVGQAATASYPDATSPIIILKMGKKVPDGIGPDSDIVAYSSNCTHMGCPIAYKATSNVLLCACHYSSFDPSRSGMQIVGHATTNLPQIVLEASGDDLFAVGVRGLIWGRQRNVV
jgi:arsenite oxidase small subunit